MPKEKFRTLCTVDVQICRFGRRRSGWAVQHLHLLEISSCLEAWLPACPLSYLVPSVQGGFLRTDWLLDSWHRDWWGSWCSPCLLSHLIKKYLFTHLCSSWRLDIKPCDCWSVFCSCPGWWQQDSTGSLLFGIPAEGQNNGSFLKMFLGLFGAYVSTKILKCGIWPIFITHFAKEPSQSLLPGGYSWLLPSQ